MLLEQTSDFIIPIPSLFVTSHRIGLDSLEIYHQQEQPQRKKYRVIGHWLICLPRISMKEKTKIRIHQ